MNVGLNMAGKIELKILLVEIVSKEADSTNMRVVKSEFRFLVKENQNEWILFRIKFPECEIF